LRRGDGNLDVVLGAMKAARPFVEFIKEAIAAKN